MDKFLLLLFFAVILTSMTVYSTPLPESKLLSSIDLNQSQYTKPTDKIEDACVDEKTQMQEFNKIAQPKRSDKDENSNEDADAIDQRNWTFLRRRESTFSEMGQSFNKFVGFRPLRALQFSYPAYSAPVYYPPEFYDDLEAYYGDYSEEDEIVSRMSPVGNRRRPTTASYKNSPIYYIRLPPTPYMFIPGLGYISQPPSYAPMASVPQPISPFYNLPLDFISNGKPTGIYQWGSPSNELNPQYVQHSTQFDLYPSYHQRPQRPSYSQRPIGSLNPFNQKSKVTNLKGPYIFNGRPEGVYLLRNSFNPIYPDPRFSTFY